MSEESLVEQKPNQTDELTAAAEPTNSAFKTASSYVVKKGKDLLDKLELEKQRLLDYAKNNQYVLKARSGFSALKAFGALKAFSGAAAIINKAKTGLLANVASIRIKTTSMIEGPGTMLQNIQKKSGSVMGFISAAAKKVEPITSTLQSDAFKTATKGLAMIPGFGMKASKISSAAGLATKALSSISAATAENNKTNLIALEAMANNSSIAKEKTKIAKDLAEVPSAYLKTFTDLKDSLKKAWTNNPVVKFFADQKKDASKDPLQQTAPNANVLLASASIDLRDIENSKVQNKNLIKVAANIHASDSLAEVFQSLIV